MPQAVNNKRNANGVKDSSETYRTFGGEHYACWTAGDIHRIDRAAYKAAGIRSRKVGDDLFVHHEDRMRAAEIDAVTANL